MLLALGAASAAVDAVKSLTSSNASAQSTGFSQASADLFGPSGGSSASGNSAPASGSTGFSQISPATMSALLAAQGQSSAATPASTSPASAMQSLFSQIDGNGDGQITKSEFENALGAGGTNLAQADHVFGQLDKNGGGTVSLGELSSALRGSGGHGHHGHAHIGGSGGSGGDPSSAGASATSVTNSNGSTTTSLTYADGSKVTMTSAVPTTSSGVASSSYNMIEQMIQREANAISLSATPLSVSA
ncbi:MAG: EF-hand domain-containing protein [Bradyrhizobium sp.]